MGDQRLEGRRCLVTGAVGGQGAAVGRRFAAEGASVAVTDLDAGRVEDLASELRDGGATAVGVAADVTDEAQVANVVAASVDVLGGLDVLYNNAGVLLTDADRPSEDLERSTWDQVLAINATGVFLFCKHALPHPAGGGPRLGDPERRIGGLVPGRRPLPRLCRQQGRAPGLHRLAGAELRAAGACGPTSSARVSWRPRWSRRSWRIPSWSPRSPASPPLRRMGKPEEVAAYAAFLASTEAAYVTDSVVTVHGGLAK